MAKRLQLSREKGFKLPFGAVKVDRSTKFGNPYRIGAPLDQKQARRWGWNISPAGLKHECKDAAEAVSKFRHALFWDVAIHDFIRTELGGKDLACWCAPGEPCHADTLIEIANSDPRTIALTQENIDRKINAEGDAVMRTVLEFEGERLELKPIPNT